MAKFYIQTDKGLIKVGNDITLENIKAALGYTPSNFSGDFYDLTNNPFSNGADGEFNIVDENQNIIAIVDKDGIHSVEMTAIKSGITHNLTEKMDVSEFESIITVDESGKFVIEDENGNEGLKLDSTGLYVKDVTAGKHVLSQKADLDDINFNNLVDNPIHIDDTGEFVIEDESGNKGFILNGVGATAKDFTTSDGVSLSNVGNRVNSIQDKVNDVDNIVNSIQDKVDSINEMISDDEEDRLIIRDGDGEVGLELNKDGLYVKDVTAGKHVLSQKADLDIVNKKLDKSEFTEIITVDETGEFVIEDEKGNVGLKLDQEGLHVNKDVITYTKDGEEEHKLSEKANQSDVDAISVITSASVSVDSNVGTPSATVSLTGDNVKNKTLNFEFKNLKGEKGEIGYGIFYTNTEYNSDTTSIIKSDIIDNVRTIQVGDLILSSNGNIFSVKEIGEPLNVEYLTSIKGIKGASVSSIVCVDGYNGETLADVNNEYGAINYYRIKDNNNNFLEGTISIKNGSDGSGGGSSDCGNINLPFEEDESGKFVIIDDSADENIGLILDSEGVTAKDFFTSSDVSLNDVGDRLSVVEDSIGIELITYDNLVQLRNNSQLIPGRQYRITDYVTTTTQEGTESAGHQFDIIVIANDNKTLSEIAVACISDRDTYFNDCNLSAWKIWYCLDNDTNRFRWANDDEGKGVIYRMIDEWGNDCPYDFKNIRFLKPDIVSDTQDTNYYYTFCYYDGNIIEDASISGDNYRVYNNVIKQYYSYYDLEHFNLELNRIMFIGAECYWWNNIFDHNCNENILGNDCDDNIFGAFFHYNTFGDDCSSNAFGDSCYGNTFGNNCGNNTFGNGCNDNTFGNDFHNNTIGNDCYDNTFGNECYGNTFGNACYENIIGDRCESNTFGDECNGNTFGYECYGNTFGNYCAKNTFGNGCYSNIIRDRCETNTFRNSCHGNTFGYDCYGNTFGNSCSDNTFRNICYGNIFGIYCSSNTFGSYCGDNIFGNSCSYNTFGNSCSYNTFGNFCSSNTFGSSKTSPSSYYRYIIFDNGNCYINLYCTSTTSSSQYYQNVRIGLGVNNTTTYKTISDSNVGQTYETLYKPVSSQTITI